MSEIKVEFTLGKNPNEIVSELLTRHGISSLLELKALLLKLTMIIDFKLATNVYEELKTTMKQNDCEVDLQTGQIVSQNDN